MTRININLGDAFLLDTPPKKQHLCIAIARISEKKYLFVNVITRRNKSETTCILLPNHPGVPRFITRESVIDYGYARYLNAHQLSKSITPGSSVPKYFCSKEVLAKIQQGALKSKRLKHKYKNALKEFLVLSCNLTEMNISGL